MLRRQRHKSFCAIVVFVQSCKLVYFVWSALWTPTTFLYAFLRTELYRIKLASGVSLDKGNLRVCIRGHYDMFWFCPIIPPKFMLLFKFRFMFWFGSIFDIEDEDPCTGEATLDRWACSCCCCWSRCCANSGLHGGEWVLWYFSPLRFLYRLWQTSHLYGFSFSIPIVPGYGWLLSGSKMEKVPSPFSWSLWFWCPWVLWYLRPLALR